MAQASDKNSPVSCIRLPRGASIVIKRRSEINVPNWFKRGRKGFGEADGCAAEDNRYIGNNRRTHTRTYVKRALLRVRLLSRNSCCKSCGTYPTALTARSETGRRAALTLLNTMRTELPNPVKIDDRDFDDVAEVDAKLLRLAHMIGGVVVTNDYNLNKVASVQRVPVLNVNDLANAIKTTVIPGEEMRTTVIKEGKEANQGVAYLNDGTMIVIDGGKNHVGEELTIVVTSVLQTSAEG